MSAESELPDEVTHGLEWAEAVHRLAAMMDRDVAAFGSDLAAASVEHIVSAREPDGSDLDLANSAIGFDTNSIFRMIRINSADAIDYLDTRHCGPLVLPGQVLNELWNQEEVLPEAAEDVSNAVNQLRTRLDKLGDLIEDDTLVAIVDDLAANSWTEFDSLGQAQDRLRLFLDVVGRRGVMPHVPRARFAAVAELRMRTRVPPGFMDRSKASNDLGDFFAWADFLAGCLTQASEELSGVVFVTHDKKKDWRTTRRRPHPVLAAEVSSLFGVPLYILTTEQFRILAADA